MAFRHTLIFDYPSRSSVEGQPGLAVTRAAGWTESFLNSEARLPGDAKFDNLVKARARCLATGLAIIGYRVSDLTHQTGTRSGKLFALGGLGEQRDVANVGVQFSAFQGLNKLRLTLHGIGDDQALAGDALSIKNLQRVFGPFFRELPNWSQLSRKLDNPRYKIVSIQPDGVVTLDVPNVSIAAGDYVNILRTRSAVPKGKQKYLVAAAVNGQKTLTLTAWDGEGAVDGEIRKAEMVTVVYPADFTFDWVVTRKIGAPSFAQRGRR